MFVLNVYKSALLDYMNVVKYNLIKASFGGDLMRFVAVFKMYLRKSIEYFLMFILCCWIGILCTMIGQYIPDIFGVSVLVSRIFKLVFDTVSISVLLYIFSYQIGYRGKNFNLRLSLISSAVLIILQQLIAPLFDHAPYISASSYRLATLIYYGGKETYNAFSNIGDPIPSLIQHLSMTAIMILVFVPTIVLGEYIGKQNRIKHEQQLIEFCNGNKN